MLFEPFHTSLTLDPKARLTLPIQLRHALNGVGINRLVAIANDGDNGGLSLFTLTAYREAIAKRTADIDPFAPRGLHFLRAVVSTNQTLTIDGHGRVLLPQGLRALANIERELVIFSMAGWFEVWNKERWEQTAYPSAVEGWNAAHSPPIDGAAKEDGA